MTLQHPIIKLEDGRVDPGPLTHQDYQAFKASLPQWRYVLAAKVLRATGLRVMEVLRLESRHYSLAGPDYFILVRRSKKRRKNDPEYEPVYLPPELGVELRDFIRGNNRKEGDRVFPFTDRQLRRVFHQAGLDGIGRGIHPHELRGLYIQTLVDGGVPLQVTAKLVGHEDPATTLGWYYNLTREKRRAIGERMPV